ncbi:MAG: hypothetical protein ACE5G1_10730, partial [bacterium]
STSVGAMASVLTVIILWTYFFIQGWQIPGYTVGGTGALPVAIILVASATAMVAGSLLSPIPRNEIIEQFFPTTGDKAQAPRGIEEQIARG